MADATLHFPQGFKWGTATAAHQVEGDNVYNQWWAWEQAPGHIENNDKSGLACDWWRNAEADFERMAELGLNAHRLSIEWSRIEPREGMFDEAAIDRYRSMLRGLRERGIEPMVTLHHFTNPLWLEERGGWEQVDVVVPAFRRFVSRVAQSMGDLCDLWCTINEPNIYAIMGYLSSGRMPPGHANQLGRALNVMRNMLLGHAAAYEVLHLHQPHARVGIAHHMRHFQGLRNGHVLDGWVAGVQAHIFNQAILNALMQGRWTGLLRIGGSQSARPVKGTLDWIGMNYYSRQVTQFDITKGDTLFGKLVTMPGAVLSDFDYGEVHPEGMMPLLRHLSQFKLPIYITENGLPDADDDQRPDFIVRHLRTLWQAINFNYPVQGYYHWTLTDNFEWSEGWRMKFGLYELNPLTQVRTPRRSAYLYRDIAQENAISSDIVRQHTPELLPVLFPSP